MPTPRKNACAGWWKKYGTMRRKLSCLEESEIEGADVVVVSYGITSRVAVKAIEMAKAEGIKVGHLRLITAWPFPEKRIRELACARESICDAGAQLRPDVL